MATNASKIAQDIKRQIAPAMTAQLTGTSNGLAATRDKFMSMKSTVTSVSDKLNKAQPLKEINKLTDTLPSGSPTPASIAALALDIIMQANAAMSIAAGKEYGKLLLKMQNPKEFKNTKLSGVLGVPNERFNDAGELIGDLTPDQSVIDAAERELREASDKYDYSDGKQ